MNAPPKMGCRRKTVLVGSTGPSAIQKIIYKRTPRLITKTGQVLSSTNQKLSSPKRIYPPWATFGDHANTRKAQAPLTTHVKQAHMNAQHHRKQTCREGRTWGAGKRTLKNGASSLPTCGALILSLELNWRDGVIAAIACDPARFWRGWRGGGGQR